MPRPQNMFLYGTLMDPDTLARALRRPVDVTALARVRLDDHRRGYIVGRDFPGLKAEAGHATEGLLLAGVTVRDVMHLNVYEGPHYQLVPVTVIDPAKDEAPIDAHTYVVKPGLKIGPAWDLEGWQQHHKPAYMSRWFA